MTPAEALQLRDDLASWLSNNHFPADWEKSVALADELIRGGWVYGWPEGE